MPAKLKLPARARNRLQPKLALGSPMSLAQQAANQARLGGGETGAYREGLEGFQKGQQVAPEWMSTYGGGGVDQMIPEPSTIVGDQTGTPYATLSEQGPEMISGNGAGGMNITPSGGGGGGGGVPAPSGGGGGHKLLYWGHDFDGPGGQSQLGGSSSIGDRRTIVDGRGQTHQMIKFNNEEWRQIDEGGIEGVDWFATDVAGVPRKAPTSHATGGSVTVRPTTYGSGGPTSGSGGGYNPIEERRRKLNQRARLLSARQNVADITAVGQANTIRDSEAYKYGAAGVARPARINLPRGVQSTSPLVEANYRTEADYLQDDFEAEDIAAGNAQLAQMGGSGGGSNNLGREVSYDNIGPEAYAKRSASGGGAGTSQRARMASAGQRAYDTMQDFNYTNPFTGLKAKLSPGELAIKKAKDDEDLKAEYEKRYPEGYDDPFTAENENITGLTKAELAIRKGGDSTKISREIARRNPAPPTMRKSQLQKLDEGNLIASLASTGKKGLPDEQARAELRARGWSDEEIEYEIEFERLASEDQGTVIRPPFNSGQGN